MPKIISKVRQLRMDYGAKEGKPVPLIKAAELMGLGRNRLTAIELGQFDEITKDELALLCSFYSKVLDRPVAISDVLEYDPNNRPPVSQLPVAA